MQVESLKVCSVCKNTKCITEFNKNKTKKDGLQTHCRACSKERFNSYWLSNKDKQSKVVQQRNKEYKILLREFLLSFLQENPCLDCGEQDPRCLDFDHVRGQKTMNISAMYGRATSLKTLKEEIEKCEVRCANCHRKKTAKDQNWYNNVNKNGSVV